MKKLSHYLNVLLVTTSLALTSCGYVSDKPVENADVYRTDELQQSCQIDVSKLSEIFKTNQKDQIKCLQDNFIQFTKYVRSKRPGSISEDELGIFVKRFFEGQSEAIIKGISLIFQLNMILLKDEADRISHNNISPLFQLLINVNQEAVILTDILTKMDDPKNQPKFWELRKQFSESTARFASSAVGIIEKAPGFGQKLNIRQFIKDMNDKIGNNQMDEDLVESFIFIKKLIVGGDEEVITSDELKQVINRLPKMLGLIFDVYYVKGSNFTNQAAEMRFYLMSIRQVYALIKFDQPNFELVNSNELVKLAKKFLKNYDVESFKPSIEALKKRFIGGNPENVTLKDLDTVLIMIHDFFEKVYFNHLTYDEADNAKLLSSTNMLPAFPQKAIAGYEDFTNARVNQLHASFADTAVTFRYFRDSSGAATYGKEIIRNKKGFIEINIAKWLSWKLLKAYGHVDAKGQMQLSMDEFAKFLLDAKPLLQEFKLWSPNFQTFSRNAVLLADLFQSRSNGDQQINIDEATEYIGMILSAVDVSGKHSDALKNGISDGKEPKKEICYPGINAEDPVYEVFCFNESFYTVVLGNLQYEKNFVLLKEYTTKVNPQEKMDYLTGVEGFARDINDPDLPINRRDSTLILGAMLNIESTFIRFDKNSDGIIDFNELNEAFVVYKDSIISLAGLKGSEVQYAKSIFMYMASKMQTPNLDGIWKKLSFWGFNYCVNNPTGRLCDDNKDIFAKRLNIGKLLYFMVNQPTPAVAPKR